MATNKSPKKPSVAHPGLEARRHGAKKLRATRNARKKRMTANGDHFRTLCKRQMGLFKKLRFVLDVEVTRWEQKQCKKSGVSKLALKEAYALRNTAVRQKKAPSTVSAGREDMDEAEHALLLLDEVNRVRDGGAKCGLGVEESR